MSDKVDVISQEPTEVKYLIGDAKDKVAKAYSMLIADNDIPDWEPISINVVVGQLNSTTKATRTFTFTSRDRPRDVLDGIIGHINTFNHDKKQFETGVADDLFTDINELLKDAQNKNVYYSYDTLVSELNNNGWHTKGHPYLDLETQVYSQKVYKYQLNDNFNISYTVKENHVTKGPHLTDWEKIVADRLSKRMN